MDTISATIDVVALNLLAIENDRYYLVDELVNDVPQPLVGQLQRHRLFGAWQQTANL